MPLGLGRSRSRHRRQFGWAAQQQVQSMSLLVALLLNLDDQRIRLRDQGLHLRQLQPRGRADIEAAREDAQGLTLAGRAPLRQAQAFIQLTQAKVSIGHLCDQA